MTAVDEIPSTPGWLLFVCRIIILNTQVCCITKRTVKKGRLEDDATNLVHLLRAEVKVVTLCSESISINHHYRIEKYHVRNGFMQDGLSKHITIAILQHEQACFHFPADFLSAASHAVHTVVGMSLVWSVTQLH